MKTKPIRRLWQFYTEKHYGKRKLARDADEAARSFAGEGGVITCIRTLADLIADYDVRMEWLYVRDDEGTVIAETWLKRSHIYGSPLRERTPK